jgi:hypothetical protein
VFYGNKLLSHNIAFNDMAACICVWKQDFLRFPRARRNGAACLAAKQFILNQ